MPGLHSGCSAPRPWCARPDPMAFPRPFDGSLATTPRTPCWAPVPPVAAPPLSRPTCRPRGRASGAAKRPARPGAVPGRVSWANGRSIGPVSRRSISIGPLTGVDTDTVFPRERARSEIMRYRSSNVLGPRIRPCPANESAALVSSHFDVPPRLELVDGREEPIAIHPEPLAQSAF